MIVFVLCECGYEEGTVDIKGVFYSFDKAVQMKRKLYDAVEEEDKDWLWYDIQAVELQ